MNEEEKQEVPPETQAEPSKEVPTEEKVEKPVEEVKPCPKCGKAIPARFFFHKECGWRAEKPAAEKPTETPEIPKKEKES